MTDAIRIRKLDPRAQLPIRATPRSVGLDIFAFLISESGRPNTAMIPPRTTKAIPTGLIMAPPEMPPLKPYALYVCSRSGLARNLSLFVTNAPGVVDPDYRGEIQVLLYNGGHESQYIQHGDRIAQIVMLPTAIPEIVEDPDLDLNTERGAAGFGSTGR